MNAAEDEAGSDPTSTSSDDEEEEARRAAEDEARRAAEEEARRTAEEEAGRKAEEEVEKKKEELRKKLQAKADEHVAEELQRQEMQKRGEELIEMQQVAEARRRNQMKTKGRAKASKLPETAHVGVAGCRKDVRPHLGSIGSRRDPCILCFSLQLGFSAHGLRRHTGTEAAEPPLLSGGTLPCVR